MGRLFGWNTRKELADHLIRGNGVHTVKHCFKGNNLWAVQEYQDKDGIVRQFIALYLIRGSNGSRDGWGYKDMDESAGPYYFNCPLAYLDMVPDPGGYATEWRKNVREYHAKANRKLEPGVKIKLYGNEYEVLGRPYKDGSYAVQMVGYGGHFRMPRRHLKDVDVPEELA